MDVGLNGFFDQFIFRNEPGDQYLAAVSRLLQNAFEFADEQPASSTDTDPASSGSTPMLKSSSITQPKANSSKPFLSLAIFRMVVMADELLESFFSEDLPNSWRLEPLTEDVKPAQNAKTGGGAKGLFTNLVSSLMTEENKEFLGKLADDLGKKLDIQHIEQKPSLGRFSGPNAETEPDIVERSTLSGSGGGAGSRGNRIGGSVSPARGSPTTMQNSMFPPPIIGRSNSSSLSPLASPLPSSQPSLTQAAPAPSTSTSLAPTTALPVASEKSLSVDLIDMSLEAEKAVVAKNLPDAPKDRVLGLGIMDERPKFAIDDAVEDENAEEGDEDLEIGDDSALMNGEFR